MMIPLFPKSSEAHLNYTCDLTNISSEGSDLPLKSNFYPTLNYHLEKGAKSYWIKREIMTIGRSFKNSLTIPVKSLSRRHCQIFRIDTEWYLEDCDSVNGTFLNQRRLSKGEKAKLSSNSKIHLGEFELNFFLPSLAFENRIPPQTNGGLWILLVAMLLLGVHFSPVFWTEIQKISAKMSPKVNLSVSYDALKSRIQQEKQLSTLQIVAERKRSEERLAAAQKNQAQLKLTIRTLQTELHLRRAKEADLLKALQAFSAPKTEVEVPQVPKEAILIPEEATEPTKKQTVQGPQNQWSESQIAETQITNEQMPIGIDPEILDQLQQYILITMENYSDPLIDLKDFKQAITRLAGENNAGSAKRMFDIYSAVYRLLSDFEEKMGTLERQKKELLARVPKERDLSPRLQKVQEQLDLVLKKIEIQEKQRIFLVQIRDWILEALVNYKVKDSVELLALYLNPQMTPFQGQVILKVIADTSDSKMVPTLIRQLSAKDVFFRSDILKTLTKLTGMNLGTAPSNWERWWKKTNPKSAKK